MQVLTRRGPRRGPAGGAPAAQSTHGLAYMPALDGVRAFAVLGVMAYHSGLSFLPAGFFGVDAFFVLSGFLITTLLVTEWSGTASVALGGFWARRARRLLPALLVMLVFVVLYARFVAAPGTYPGLRWDSIATLFYSANWRYIVAGQSYFALTGPVSPLLHTWSLAIEEQFYIAWPIVVLLVMRVCRRDTARGLRTLLGVSVAGALGSALEMALVFTPGTDPTRVYFGTDTHAQCLLVGAALASGLALWRRRPAAEVARRARVVLAGAGVAGVGVCAWAWSQLQYGQTFVFRGGFLLVSLSVAAVILSAVLVPAGVVSRGLAWAPLRYIGRISYGMYLWHFPLDIALTGTRVGVTGTPLFLVRTAVTIAVSTVSFYAVERPIRTRAVLSAVRARVVTPAAVAATAAVIVAATVPSGAAVGSPPVGGGGATVPETGVPASLAHAPVRVLVLGDSVALSMGVGLVDAEPKYHIVADDLAILGCGVAEGPKVWQDVHGQEEEVPVAYPCRPVPKHGAVPWTTAWPSWIGAVHPNVVVLLAGRWEVSDRIYKGRRTNILAPAYAAYVKAQLERAVTIGTSTGARMVLMTAPCYDSGEQPDGAPFPEDQLSRVERYNDLVRQVAAEHPSSVTVQDLFSMVCPGGAFTPTYDGAQLRSADGIHFDQAAGTGAALLASRILPLWEQVGHEQEAAGGQVLTTPLPTRLSPP